MSAPKGGWLKEPLTPEESKHIGELYVRHQGLIRLLGSKMTRQFPMVDKLDVFSCIDVAFIKSCRAFDPNKGKFSTIFTRFASGEVRHFIRDHNWQIKAPGPLRELSRAAKQLLNRGHTLKEAAVLLDVDPASIVEAMKATAEVFHEVAGWEHHQCSRATPMEQLMAEEEMAS